MKNTTFSKALMSLSALTCVGWISAVQAQEIGQVISRTPVYQQVAVPRQVCTQSQVLVPAQNSGAGAVMGAVAGGALGNAIGKGEGRALATMIGVIGGAIAGDKIESPGTAQAHTQQTCTTQKVYENRLIGFNVVYEFSGKQYTVQLPQDPGPTIKLQITPISQAPSGTPADTTVMAETQTRETLVNRVYSASPQVVYVPSPYYRSYSPYPFSTSLNIDIGSPRHRHWR
jgi:uncharacterized protein YcfJ